MANLRINIKADLSMAVLRQVVTRIENPRPLYKAWGNYLEGRVVRAFKSETAPDGSRWAALKPATVDRKRKRKSPRSKNKILRDSGTLYDTIAVRLLPNGVEIGTNQQVGAYSLGAIHQFGAPRANISARPLLPMTPDGSSILPQDLEELEQITLRWLEGQRF